MSILDNISLEEGVLKPEDYQKQLAVRIRINRTLDNTTSFIKDFMDDDLVRYEGSYVLYKRGVWCGQSSDLNKLREWGSYKLAKKDLAIYLVPKRGEEITQDKLVNHLPID